MSYTKFVLKNATISDKIYFKKEDLEQDVDDIFYDHFHYKIGDEFATTFQFPEEGENTHSIPSGSFYKIDFKNVVDNRPLFNRRNWKFKGILKTEQQIRNSSWISLPPLQSFWWG